MKINLFSPRNSCFCENGVCEVEKIAMSEAVFCGAGKAFGKICGIGLAMFVRSLCCRRHPNEETKMSDSRECGFFCFRVHLRMNPRFCPETKKLQTFVCSLSDIPPFVENTICEPILQNPYYQGDKYVNSRVVTLS
ncbi:hypothetical protein [uncultured Alistipes sp.]|uniref:hypothetical protein n=1 Tax=uncultured Alistipes sp. TaxID=538949 RepID=UPI00272A3FDB|nr:hypothetical protein [uncultured Alistipes sp.]